MKRAGASLLLLLAIAAVGAAWLAPNDPNRRFEHLLYAPPTRVYFTGGGALTPPARVVTKARTREGAGQSGMSQSGWRRGSVILF